MDDEIDILRKADALLHRQRPAGIQDFPVLTEVVETSSIVPQPLETKVNVGVPSLQFDGLTSSEIEDFERRILERLQPAIEAKLLVLIESTTGPHLRTLIEHALETASKEVSRSMTTRTAELVTETVRAVLQVELSEFRSRLNRR